MQKADFFVSGDGRPFDYYLIISTFSLKNLILHALANCD